MIHKRLVGKQLTARQFRVLVRKTITQLNELDRHLDKYDEEGLNRIFGEKRTKLTNTTLTVFDSELGQLERKFQSLKVGSLNYKLKLLRQIVNVEYESRFLDKEE